MRSGWRRGLIRPPVLLRRLAAVGVTTVLLIGLCSVAPVHAAPATTASLERCSGPYAVTPDRLDTMRVCISWNSDDVWGWIRYYPSAIISPYRYSEYDWSMQLFVQNQTYGPPTFLSESPALVDSQGPAFNVPGPKQPNIGKADNTQTYYVRGTTAVNGQQFTGVTGVSPSVTT
jgi:hypothetical protein